MYRSKNKIIVTIIVLISTFFGVAIYHASQKISPKEIRQLALDQLHKAMPGASIELGKVTLSVGTSLSLKLDKLLIKDLKTKSHFVSLENMQLKIPVFALLAGGGTIDLIINDPHVSLTDAGKGGNWERIFAKSKKQIVKKNHVAINKKRTNTQKEDQSNSPPFIVSFFKESSVNIRIEGVKFDLDIKNVANSTVILKRLVVNNFNLKGTTAYEIDSSVSGAFFNKKLKTNILLIGQLDVAKYLSNKEISSLLMFKIFNTEFENFPVLSEMKSDIKIKIDSSNVITADFNGSLLGNNFHFNLKRDLKVLKLSDIKMGIEMATVADLIPSNIKDIDLNSANMSITGEVEVLSSGQIVPLINVGVDSGIKTSFANIEMKHSLKASLAPGDLRVVLDSTILDGTLKVAVQSLFDINKFDINALPVVNVSVNAQGLNIPQEILLPSPTDTTKKEHISESKSHKGIAREKKERVDIPIFPKLKLDLKIDDSKFVNDDLSIDASINVAKRSVDINKLFVKMNNGQLHGKVNVINKKNKLRSKINLRMNKFDLSFFSLFVKGLVEQVEATASGKIIGSVTLDPNSSASFPKSSVLINLNMNNAKLHKIKLSEMVTPLLNKISLLKKHSHQVDKLKLDGNIDTFILSSRLVDNKFNISKMLLSMNKKKVTVSGDGYLYLPPTDKSSKVNLTLADQMGVITKPLYKNTGLKTLPLSLVGPGIELMPDTKYTLKILSKSAAKKALTKNKKKLKKKAKKKVEELIKNKNVKKLLKGLF